MASAVLAIGLGAAPEAAARAGEEADDEAAEAGAAHVGLVAAGGREGRDAAVEASAGAAAAASSSGREASSTRWRTKSAACLRTCASVDLSNEMARALGSSARPKKCGSSWG